MAVRRISVEAEGQGLHEITGEVTEYNSDKYQDNRDIQPSLLFKELNPEAEREDPQLTLDFGTERSHK